MKKTLLLTFFLTITISVYSVPPFFKNEIAVIKKSKSFDLEIGVKSFNRYLTTFSNYSILSFELEGIYAPNSSVEVGFSIPYLLMYSSGDTGSLGDIELFSKFTFFKEVFSFIDNFIFQNTIVINISLATGIKKEDSYRNIGLTKGLYYPLSSGYSDLTLGVASTILGNYNSLSVYTSFVSVSSKIEPPLAFNTENDHFVLGSTLELFLYYSKNFSTKTFLETTYYLPISTKSKYLNIWFVGSGVWLKLYDTFIFQLGYYYNLLDPFDIEKYYKSILQVNLGIRF